VIFPSQVTDNLRILGNEYFHFYLIQGNDTCALVEIGISATADILLEQLSSMGAEPDFLIVTHPHSDHVTSLDYLKQAFPKAKVIAGKGAESFLNHPKAMKSMMTEDRHMMESMISQGLFTCRPVIAFPPSLSGCTIMNDGDELDLGGLMISFLEARGHSPGNILVHIPDLKTLLVSDSLGNRYPGQGFFPTFFTGYTDYLATIDRLSALNPQILGLAHNGLFSRDEDIKAIFQKSREAANYVKKYIINDDRDDETIARNLFKLYYNDELTIYSPENILNCCRLLVRRIREL
jgi:glyoxylase-like metal-dependent hydrolase (beta-lactamase superfamily II)